MKANCKVQEKCFINKIINIAGAIFKFRGKNIAEITKQTNMVIKKKF